MAFLKSSQLSLGPKTIDVKGFTQAETLKLGDRAYTEHEVLLADNYNIVGDITVSDNLILSKLSDDGNAINITGDTTTRTITGSGSIEGATLAQTPNAVLTGMTGELGSGVTFPTGHIIQIVNKVLAADSSGAVNTNTSYYEPGGTDAFSLTITPTAAGNNLFVVLNYLPKGRAPSNPGDMTVFTQLLGGPTSSMTQQWELQQRSDNLGKLGDTVLMPLQISRNLMYSGASAAEHKFTVKVRTEHSSAGVYPVYGGGDLTIMELQG